MTPLAVQGNTFIEGGVAYFQLKIRPSNPSLQCLQCLVECRAFPTRLRHEDVDSGIRIKIVRILEDIPDQFELGEDEGDILKLVLDQGWLLLIRSESETDFLNQLCTCNRETYANIPLSLLKIFLLLLTWRNVLSGPLRPSQDKNRSCRNTTCSSVR